MKVLLISANQVTEPYPVYPLGLDFIVAALLPAHQVEILDLNHMAQPAAQTERIRSFGPDFVGISLRNVDNTDVTNPNGFLDGYKSLIETVRAACRAPVILGGSGFTIFPTELMAYLKADYGILGEGERLPLLLDALARGQNPGCVEGVILPGQTSRAPQPWNGDFIRRFDALAPHLDFYLKHSGMLNLQTKRGCPFQCIYCTYPHIEGRHLRLMLPMELGQTAARLEAAGARYLFVTDSAFNADVPHSLAVAQAFQQAGLSIPWGAFFTPTRIPADYFKVLADCGLRHVEFGTESLSDPVLKAYGKPFREREISAAHDLARQAGLHVAHYFLFGGPGETSRTLAHTLRGMDRLERSAFFLFCGMRIYPNTTLYDLAVAQGQIKSGENIIEPVYYRSPQIDGREISDQIESAARGRTNWVIGAGGRSMASVMERMYRKGFSGPLWEYLCR